MPDLYAINIHLQERLEQDWHDGSESWMRSRSAAIDPTRQSVSGSCR